jgi:hypothetical protein
MSDTSEPAFPSPEVRTIDGMGVSQPYYGMTLRDYFAAHAPPLPADLMALAMEAADTDNPDKTHGEKSDVLLDIRATWNYRYADAMLAARTSAPPAGGGKEGERA